jgi:glycerol-3-phosphate acyltransferase PlsY
MLRSLAPLLALALNPKTGGVAPWTWPALIGGAYLAGSIPFGLLIGLAKGKDPRQHGSRNIGATNVGRLFGAKYFALVFTLDMLKGLLPMLAAGWVAARLPSDRLTYLLWLCTGFATILGHMFSVFIGFKGGKGVATSFGVVLGLWPYYTWPAGVTLVTFLAAFNATRYVSVGSIAASAAFPIAYVAMGLAWHWDPLGRQLPLLIFALVVPALIIHKHRGNISRLRAGQENKFGHKTE